MLEIGGLRGPAPGLTAGAFEDGSDRPLGGLLVPVTLHQRTRDVLTWERVPYTS